MGQPRGLGRNLSSLLASSPEPREEPPQVRPAPSATDLQQRLDALSREVRDLRDRIDDVLRHQRRVGVLTGAALWQLVFDAHRCAWRLALAPARCVGGALRGPGRVRPR